MDKSGVSAVLGKISLGEIDLDEISEVLRSSESVIQSYRQEVDQLRQTEEALQSDLDKEKQAVDDLCGRLVKLHDENRIAREAFRTEIEGKMQILGITPALDLQSLDITGLLMERERLQQQMGQNLR